MDDQIKFSNVKGGDGKQVNKKKKNLNQQLYKAVLHYKCLIKYKVGQVPATKKYPAFRDQARG